MSREVRWVPELDAKIAKAGMVPFQREPWVNPRTGRIEPRVLGERPPYQFRVSQGFWDRVVAPLGLDEGLRLEYGGWPVEIDASLPGEVVLFEEIWR